MNRLPKEEVVTKKFFKDEVKKLDQKFERVFDKFDENEIRFQKIEEKIPDNFDKKLSNIQETLDFLVGEFKRFDEEHTLLSHRVGDHNDRIEKLELNVFGTSETV